MIIFEKYEKNNNVKLFENYLNELFELEFKDLKFEYDGEWSSKYDFKSSVNGTIILEEILEEILKLKENFTFVTKIIGGGSDWNSELDIVIRVPKKEIDKSDFLQAKQMDLL